MARVRRGATVWADLIDQWQKSGLSMPAFCERRGLNLGTMQGWVYKRCHRLKLERVRHQADTDHRPDETSPAAAFLPVHLAAPIAAAGAGIEVVLGSGLRILVAAGFDPETLRRVVAVLEDRPC